MDRQAKEDDGRVAVLRPVPRNPMREGVMDDRDTDERTLHERAEQKALEEWTRMDYRERAVSPPWDREPRKPKGEENPSE